MSIVYLSLGSNLGQREANLQAALEALPPWVQVKACSSVYETAPWGYANQPSYLNLVVQGLTHLPPRRLLYSLKRIEARLGRRATFRYGPRTIDLDILAYDDLRLDTPGLSIPHPRMQERAFVLVPLCEIAPAWVHPRLKRTACALCASIDTEEVVPWSPTSAA